MADPGFCLSASAWCRGASPALSQQLLPGGPGFVCPTLGTPGCLSASPLLLGFLGQSSSLSLLLSSRLLHSKVFITPAFPCLCLSLTWSSFLRRVLRFSFLFHGLFLQESSWVLYSLSWLDFIHFSFRESYIVWFIILPTFLHHVCVQRASSVYSGSAVDLSFCLWTINHLFIIHHCAPLCSLWNWSCQRDLAILKALLLT